MKKEKIAWIFLILSPVLAIFTVALVTGTNPFCMDAWNTTWNDEIGYYRAANCMKNYGLPGGMNGYNEVLTKYRTFGPYNYATYFPHMLFIIVTSLFGNNMIIFANVLMMILTYVFVACVLKPSYEKSILLILFQFVNMIGTRYVWSGMSEAVSISAVLIIISCSVFLNMENKQYKKRIFVVVQVTVILAIGIIRPFLWAFIVIPLWYIMAHIKGGKKKIALCFLGSGLSIAGMIYFWMNKNVCAPFFASANPSVNWLDLIRRGQMKEILKLVYCINRDSIKLIWDELWIGSWRSVVFLALLIQLVLIIIFSLKKKKSNNNENNMIGFLYFLISVLIFEANILLYTVNQLHRMLLAIMIGAVFWGIMTMKTITNISYQGVFAILILVTVLNCSESYALPQKNNTYDAESVIQQLKKAVQSEDVRDPWEMTFAFTPNHGSYYTIYAMPSYMGAQCCRGEWLKNQIMDETLCSRYVLLCADDDMETRELCERSFKLLWQDGTWYLYDRKVVDDIQKIDKTLDK